MKNKFEPITSEDRKRLVKLEASVKDKDRQIKLV
jgi:hypothetical protein